MRENWPVVVLNDEIIWVPGIAVSPIRLNERDKLVKVTWIADR